MAAENQVHETKDPPPAAANGDTKSTRPDAGPETDVAARKARARLSDASVSDLQARHDSSSDTDDDEDTFHDAEDEKAGTGVEGDRVAGMTELSKDGAQKPNSATTPTPESNGSPTSTATQSNRKLSSPQEQERPAEKGDTVEDSSDSAADATAQNTPPNSTAAQASNGTPRATSPNARRPTSPLKSRNAPAVSEWSHQRLATQATQLEEAEEEESWQAMPALGEYDIYDEENRLVARGTRMQNDDEAAYGGIGGAGKGYTRVQLDEDAQSATSMDEDTSYLFKEGQKNAVEDDEEQRDAAAQLDATKDLLTEGQRIAYVGVARLSIWNMIKELESFEKTRTTKKELNKALESMEKWGQAMMVRVYGHMEIDSAEQVMIEQLAEHGVQPADLVPPLMQTSRVRNPMAGDEAPPAYSGPSTLQVEGSRGEKKLEQAESDHVPAPEQLPSQDVKPGEEVPEVQKEEMPMTQKIDIDLRWTVLCDLFLMLISDSIYDARSRFLLEKVASAMGIDWIQVCRFEKRVIDALEMQEQDAKENWNETEHMEKRRKLGLKHKYMVMGLATVGGGLVIGLSAGLLAPVIGAGLAAGFTTIGVSGTATFLSGVGGAALITSAATAAGGTVAVRASDRRTGHVKTFEYRPLHNNKRVNLVLTVSGWMSGKVDDVRLPYSTVDPIVGDIYSLLWEPEMLRSMGDTINILANEALTQTVQQVLGATILTALMASLQLPIVLTKLSYLIDNPWSVSLDRANLAGKILADSLIDRHLGNRPVTLLGFSLGSRLIFSCLQELSSRGAYGLVQNVYLFGSPIVAAKDQYLRARSVVSGRFVNGYSTNDWILAYLFRATSGGLGRVAGLSKIEEVPGIENVDVTQFVVGHMAYRAAMPRLLREVGWEVESDEFTEIEDPDPENHEQRQRELIREIDEARKQAEAKPEKKRFGLFKFGKMAEKKGWEKYDAKDQSSSHKRSESTESLGGNDWGNPVLFDIDAIKKELLSEMIEVRELDSTLPPMQISSRSGGNEDRQEASLITNGDHKVAVKTVLEQQGLDAEEIARMKLPPRPDEIADDHATPPVANGRVHEAEYDDDGEAPPPPLRMEFEPSEEDFIPREIKSTLPPLTLTPSLPSGGSVTPALRPELKSHATAPHLVTARSTELGEATSPMSPVEQMAEMGLDHNAWAADDENEFGKRRGVRMTFE